MYEAESALPPLDQEDTHGTHRKNVPAYDTRSLLVRSKYSKSALQQCIQPSFWPIFSLSSTHDITDTQRACGLIRAGS
jgi:hypothetical protein